MNKYIFQNIQITNIKFKDNLNKQIEKKIKNRSEYEINKNKSDLIKKIFRL